jgi:tetratricopeptide (TPR) repeat protein
VKRRLTEKVFQVMTCAVPDAKAAGAYEQALTTVERFLDLFPGYLAALRLYCETCHAWLSALSFERWDEIIRLAGRCEDRVRCLGCHPHLRSDPLAEVALEDLAFEFALRGHDRGRSYLGPSPEENLTVTSRDAARAAFEFAVRWGRLGYPYSRAESRVRSAFGVCATALVVLLDGEAAETCRDPTIDTRLMRAAAATLYRTALGLLEEAIAAEPDSELHRRNLSVVQNRLRDLGDWPQPPSEAALASTSPEASADPATSMPGPSESPAPTSTNPWRRGPLSQNPYLRTAFRAARVPREVVKRRSVVNLILQTRQLIESDPQAHTIRGRPVSIADVNAAESVLLDPMQRAREELLEHTTERLPLERLRNLAQQAVDALGPEHERPLAATSLECLLPWVVQLSRSVLEGSLGADPSFGALELALVPPHGESAWE